MECLLWLLRLLQSIKISLGKFFLLCELTSNLLGIGRVFMAPIDVDLGPKNVYQPDLVVILNAHLERVTEKKIIGAPDLVVEVASPSTAAYDRLTKYEKYAQAGDYRVLDRQT